MNPMEFSWIKWIIFNFPPTFFETSFTTVFLGFTWKRRQWSQVIISQMLENHKRKWAENIAEDNFSYPSSSIPTLATDWLTDSNGFRAFQTRPTWPTYLNYLPDLPTWPIFQTKPTWPTYLTYLQKTFSTIQTLNWSVSQFLQCFCS